MIERPLDRPPVPDWLKSAAGPLGARLLGLWSAGSETLIEVDAGAGGSLLLVLRPPGNPDLPFSCPSFGLGYRNPPGGPRPVHAELCSWFGKAIAAVPGTAERLLSIDASALSPLPRSSVRRAEPPDVVDERVGHAIARLAKGDPVGALAAWRALRDHGASAAIPDRVRRFFSRVEGRELHEVNEPPPTPAEPPSPAWERAWAGDLATARRLAEARPEDPGALGLLGALRVLEGRPAEALPLLSRALEQGARDDIALHRVRALVHLGLVDEAARAVGALEDQTFAREVLTALTAVRTCGEGDFPGFRRKLATSEHLHNGLFAVQLPALVGERAMKRALRSRASTEAFIEGLLDRMAGNLGASPTFAETAPGGGRRFVRLALPPTRRDEAADALYTIARRGVAGAEAAFTALLTRHPRSSQALTYKGELYLWLGRYGDAFRVFAASRLVEPMRWADIGILASLTLSGHLVAARLAAIYAERHFPPARGGSLPVYRGLLRRRIGDLAGAASDLREAVAVKPTRIGARMELCLALRAAGVVAEAAQQTPVILREAAPILVDAADALGLDWVADPALLASDPVLEEALSAMRGNRASGIVTWIDRAGALRILVRPDLLRDEASRLLSDLGLARRAPRG